MAMHRHECKWGDLLDEFQDWKHQVAELCAPALDKIAAMSSTPKKCVMFVDSTPTTSRVTSPLFMEPVARSMAPSPQQSYFTSSVSIVPDKTPLTDLFAPPLPSTNTIKTIIARNLPRIISTEELRERFQLYGVVRDVYLPKNKDVTSRYYGSIRGFALIKYESATQSERAIRMLSVLGLTIHGKKVTVEFSKSDTPDRT